MHRIHYVSSITIARIMFNCYCNWRIFSLLIEKLPTSFVSKFFPTLIKTGSKKKQKYFSLTNNNYALLVSMDFEEVFP